MINNFEAWKPEFRAYRSCEGSFLGRDSKRYRRRPLMAVIMLMASNQKVMGKLVIPTYLKGMGWAATVVMLCACIGISLTWK
jgi:hypothetical protein